MKEEKWLPIVGHENAYEVSDLGRVRSITRTTIRRDGKPLTRRGQLLSWQIDSGGYAQVVLFVAGARHRQSVHRLVLTTFVGQAPTGTEACHTDDDSLNNRLDNLRWDTRSANIQDMVRNGRHFQASQTQCKQGHDFTTENTRYTNGRRVCRSCVRIKRTLGKVAS